MPIHTPRHTEPLFPRDEALREALLIVVEQPELSNLTQAQAEALAQAIAAGYWPAIEAEMIGAGLMTKPTRSGHPHGHTGRF